MLAWLQAVLPDLHVANFTSDWNNGIALSALLDYCKPGLYQNWKSLNPRDGVNNCRVAMNIAKDEFSIPMILTPEDLASHNMDELSGMTYLSYFMKEDSPGYSSTLTWVQKQLPHLKIKNFTRDWNDGLALCSLVHSLGASIPGFPNIRTDPSQWEQNLQKGINGGKYLGVEPVLRAKEMADPEVQHLGVMAYIARFQFIKPRKRPGDKISITGTDLNKVHVNKPAHFKINILDTSVDLSQIRAEVHNSSRTINCQLNINRNGGSGTFVATDTGIHELIVYCEGEVVTGCPLKIHVHPDISKILFSGIDPCALGSIVEVLINSNGAGGGNVQVEAVAPSCKARPCPVNETNGVYTATFTPDEIGEWRIGVTYSGEHINGSPFTCYVYDPTKVKVLNLKPTCAGQEFTFTCDASEAGWGEVKVDVQHNNHSLPLQVDERGNGLYRVSFTPLVPGKYKIYVSFNGIDLKQSPFTLKVFSPGEDVQDSGEGHTSSASHIDSHSLRKSNVIGNSQHMLSSAIHNNTEVNVTHSITKASARETQHSVFNSESSNRTDVVSKLEHMIGSPALRRIENSLIVNSANSKQDSDVTHRVGQNSAKRMLSKDLLTKNPKVAPPPPPEKPGKVDVKTRSWMSRDDQKHVVSSQNHTNTSDVLGLRHEEKTVNLFQSNVIHHNNARVSSVRADHQRSLLKADETTHFKDSYNDANQSMLSSSSEITSSTGLHGRQEERAIQSKHHHQMQDHLTTGKYVSSGSLGRKKGPVDVTAVTATGDGLNFVPVKRPVTFTISAKGFEADDINITVTAPSSREIPIRLDTIRPGQYEVEYITPEVGEHVIDIIVAGKPLKTSPFHCFAYDASKIRVGRIPDGLVGQAVEFEIDGAEAGSGNLEILVNGGHVTSQVKNLGNHRFLASFIPHNATVHTIEMKFNGESVPGSPWRCEVMDSIKKISAKGSGLKSFSAGHTSFNISAPGFHKDDVQVKITGPGKSEIQPRVIDLHNGNFRVEYSTFDIGNYMIEVQVAGKRIAGSPFTAKAYDAKRIIITDIPHSSTVGQTCQFQVDASQAGEGQLEISVNDGEVPNQVQVLGNGRCLVIFKAEAAVPHTIDIKFNGENVPGCPFVVDVGDSTQFALDLANLELVPVGRSAHFQVSVAGGCESELQVTILSPSGSRVPVKLSQISSNLFSGEFTPKELGPHSVTVEYAGSPVNGSPFTVKVYNSQKVVVSGVSHGVVGKTIQFTVDASHAGEGNLEITVSARGRNIPTQVHPMGSARFGVSFVPAEPVEHVISVGFNKEPVAGSPFKVRITEANKVSVRSSSLVATSVHKTTSFVIQNVSSSEKDISVKVEGPDGSIIPAKVLENGGNSVKVDYTPTKAGEYRIHVSYMGSSVPGSPFVSKVFDARQIVVKDIPNGIVGKPVVFMVETSQAGPGNLEVMVNNGQVPTTPEPQSPTLYAISFVPRDTRPHMIDLKFNGEPVPGSPFECTILDPSKVKASGEGLERVAIHKAASFFIDTRAVNMGECKVSIIGPMKRHVDAHISGNYSTGYKVEYTPTDIGDHSVDVRISGTAISGSPFLVKAYDATKVKVSDIGSGIVGRPVYFSIDASQAGAGNLEIIVSVSGRNVPNYVQSEGNAKFRVNFKPSEPQMHTISVKFNGEPVPGSPFYVKILDSNHSVVTGTSLRMAAVAKGASFTVDTRGIENADCKVVVTGPSSKKLPVNITKTSTTTFSVQFSPVEVGPHQVAVMLDGSPVPGSPFTCNVYDVNKINVTGLNPGLVGKPLTFQVDASQAGEGTLELVVTTRKSSVRAEVSMRSRGLYDVTFVPQEKTSHYVNITFNEEDVPNSPFKIEVRESLGEAKVTESSSKSGSGSISLMGESSKQGLVGSVNVFEVDASALDGDVDIKVTGPQDVSVQTTVARTERGHYRAEYLAREVGTYKVEVLHQGTPVSNKPFLLEVCDPSRVKVMDVEDGVIGRPQSFKVDASRAGRGNLTVNITAGGREVRHTIKENGGGIYQVAYIPRNDFPHKIEVFYNGHQAPGCPQIVEMRDPSQSIIVHGAGLKCTSLEKNATFMIETGGFGEAKDFDILVTGPNGSPLPVKCYQQKDGSLLVEWTAQETGSHKVDVLYSGKAVGGSPFTCHVFDASKISIQKIRTTTFTVNERISFALNRRDAGYAELDVTVTSPLGRHLPIEVKGTTDGEGETIEFTPTVPGKYKIAITYGDVEVPGSPITFTAQEGGTPKVEGNGLNVAQLGKPAIFKIDGRGLWGKPEVRVEGPDSEAECNIEEEEEGMFIATYVPQEIGVFDVRVLWNNRDVPGSPFHPRVVNAENVRIVGGWNSIMDEQGHIVLSVGEEKRIPFDVSDAGPGKLKAEVRGPNGMVDVRVEQMSNHRYRVCFSPQDEGEYYLYLYYADMPLPQSPYLAYAEEISPALDHTRVVLRGHGLAGARVGQETEFVIDGSEAGPGLPEISLSGVKADIPVKLTPLGNNTYKAVYTPSIPGAYLLNVMWSDRQVKGCPLKVTVVPSCDSSKVICSGDGLRGGTVGKEIKAFIDTRRAGPGELTAHCTGPHKVAYCELYDHRDGTFTLYLKPQEGGRHVLTIKYGGEHVMGSPFTLRIAGAPDASKVRVYGPGIEPGVLASYQSRFICDTRGAGAGQLTVRIRGPKGAFRVEMQRESQKDRTILCKYDPTEPGDYRLEVKWSGEHVPGSPFVVMIFDTQQELNRYLQGQSNSASGPSNLLPADYFGGSMTYSTGFGQMSWRGSTAEL